MGRVRPGGGVMEGEYEVGMEMEGEGEVEVGRVMEGERECETSDAVDREEVME